MQTRHSCSRPTPSRHDPLQLAGSTLDHDARASWYGAQPLAGTDAGAGATRRVQAEAAVLGASCARTRGRVWRVGGSQRRRAAAGGGGRRGDPRAQGLTHPHPRTRLPQIVEVLGCFKDGADAGNTDSSRVMSCAPVPHTTRAPSRARLMGGRAILLSASGSGPASDQSSLPAPSRLLAPPAGMGWATTAPRRRMPGRRIGCDRAVVVAPSASYFGLVCPSLSTAEPTASSLDSGSHGTNNVARNRGFRPGGHAPNLHPRLHAVRRRPRRQCLHLPGSLPNRL